MKKETVKVSSLVDVPEFKSYYSEQPIAELVESIQNDGLKIPIIISSENEIIDGYRRVAALKELGIEDVEVLVDEVRPALDERVLRNMYRKKTSMDEVNEMKTIFQRYPKRQGKRNNGHPYSRVEQISKALNQRWKDDSVLNKLEFVLNNDLENNLLSKSIIEKKADVEHCYEFLKNTQPIDAKGKYGYTDKLIKGELTVSDTNKLTKKRYELENEFKTTFIIPEKCNSFNINCVEVGKMDKHKGSVSLLFTSIPYFILRKYQNGDPNQLGHEKTKEEYCSNVANIIKELIPTLKETANIMINIGETYEDGVGYGIPQLLKETIEKNTTLIYKDLIVWSKRNPKPQNEKVMRPVNNVEYILWFVVNPKVSKYNLITFPVPGKEIKISKGVKDVDNRGIVWGKRLSLTNPYGKIYTHMKEQEVENIIECIVGKNHDVYRISQEGHPAIMSAMLPVIPILMTTDEGDVVFDPFAGSNVVGRMTCLLNRVALSTELSQHYYKIGCKMLESGVDDFDMNSLNFISSEVYRNNGHPQHSQAA